MYWTLSDDNAKLWVLPSIGEVGMVSKVDVVVGNLAHVTFTLADGAVYQYQVYRVLEPRLRFDNRVMLTMIAYNAPDQAIEIWMDSDKLDKLKAIYDEIRKHLPSLTF